MNKETRALSLIDCRIARTEETRTFSGYACVWGVVDSYGTTFARGCFTETLRQHNENGTLPFMFANHDMRSFPIGDWQTMEEDDYGLRVTGELHETSDGNDAYYLLRKNKVNGLSIGFIPVEMTLHEDRDEHLATFTEVRLLETSVVYAPSNAKALVTDVRSAIKEGMSVRELEALLRNFMSRQDAVAVASQFESKQEVRNIEEKFETLAAIERFNNAIRK